MSELVLGKMGCVGISSFILLLELQHKHFDCFDFVSGHGRSKWCLFVSNNGEQQIRTTKSILPLLFTPGGFPLDYVWPKYQIGFY